MPLLTDREHLKVDIAPRIGIKFFALDHTTANLRCLAVIARDLDANAPTVPPLPFRVANGKIVGRNLMNVLVDKSAIAARHERD